MTVPANRFQDVIDVLATPRSTEKAEASTPELLGFDSWDEESTQQMWDESTPEQREFLHELANSGDNGMTTQDIKDLVGVTSVPGFLGALARRCSNRYGRTYPVRNDWTEEAGSLYVMPESIRPIIKTIANS
jgi:hypothetical protein